MHRGWSFHPLAIMSFTFRTQTPWPPPTRRQCSCGNIPGIIARREGEVGVPDDAEVQARGGRSGAGSLKTLKRGLRFGAPKSDLETGVLKNWVAYMRST